jgi:sugar/nucleoside kinase (ribokinase family)
MVGRKPKEQAREAPVAVGAGLLALDVVFAEGVMVPLGRWAGGTCGNVLTILAFLGWDAYPVARLKKNDESDQIPNDLGRWKVNTDFIRFEDGGSTPVIIEYLRRNGEGAATHRFSLRCPVCGSRLPSFRPVTLGAVQPVVEKVDSPAVFFFDRVSPSALSLAKRFGECGAVVAFEPTTMGDERQFEKAVRLSHIVKYSHERLSPLSTELQQLPLLIIETLGQEGLRYRSNLESCKSTKWRSVEPFAVPNLLDSAGAGDWCSAAVISKLAASRLSGLQRSTASDVESAIMYGQAAAAWSCRFESPRGGMYRAGLDTFRRDIHRIVTLQSLSESVKFRRRQIEGATGLCMPGGNTPDFLRRFCSQSCL